MNGPNLPLLLHTHFRLLRVWNKYGGTPGFVRALDDASSRAPLQRGVAAQAAPGGRAILAISPVVNPLKPRILNVMEAEEKAAAADGARA